MSRTRFIALLVSLLLAACTFDEPLAPAAEIPIDDALLGHWAVVPDPEQDPGGETVQVERADANHYAIEYRDGDSVILFKGWLAERDGIRFLQLEVTGDEDGPAAADEPNRYSVVSVHFEGDELVMHSLNTELVGPHDADTATLAEAFSRHHDDPLLFIEPGRFSRL